jgi:hypothetical protein
MEPNRENDEQPDVWPYAWHRTPPLRERIRESLSGGGVVVWLAIASIVLLVIAIHLGAV